MDQYLDIDYLKSLGVEPSSFGLGFIQLKLNDLQRIHFWTGAPVVGDEEIHDHRYTFASTVLQGELTHKTFDFEPAVKGQYVRVQVSCDPKNAIASPEEVRGHIIKTGSYILPTGAQYGFKEGQFHQSSAKPNTVTFLQRETHRRLRAHVIRPLGATNVCPFSVPQERLWEQIEAVIDRPRPGYHVDNITKGVMGDPSKIAEEVSEFIDATKQGVDIMAIVELSDLIGAVDAYLLKNHPTISLDDLTKMAAVTKRAFDNGYRN